MMYNRYVPDAAGVYRQTTVETVPDAPDTPQMSMQPPACPAPPPPPPPVPAAEPARRSLARKMISSYLRCPAAPSATQSRAWFCFILEISTVISKGEIRA